MYSFCRLRLLRISACYFLLGLRFVYHFTFFYTNLAILYKKIWWCLPLYLVNTLVLPEQSLCFMFLVLLLETLAFFMHVCVAQIIHLLMLPGMVITGFPHQSLLDLSSFAAWKFLFVLFLYISITVFCHFSLAFKSLISFKQNSCIGDSRNFKIVCLSWVFKLLCFQSFYFNFSS